MKTVNSCLQLSIVIPVYDRQSQLNELLSELSDRVLSGGFEDTVEVIVVDDASKEFIDLSKYSFKTKLIRNIYNSGAPLSREKGFEVTSASFIHFHDSDDSFSKEWLVNVLSEVTNNPDTDLLMTARFDQEKNSRIYKCQKYFHKQVSKPEEIKKRLVYRNCLGPLGGVTFSRRVLGKISFKGFASCQDWQMYLDAIEYSKVLNSLPDTQFIFNKTGEDRISHNPRKKILGHLQLAKITSKKSPFKKNIRLFYLYTCKQHIFNQGGLVLSFYKKNKFKIFFTYLLVSIYWRVT